MRAFLLQVYLELRLIYRMRWPLLLPLPAGAWMLLQCLNISDSSVTDINLFAAEAHRMLMIVLPAVPILLGVLLIRRDTMNPSYEWILGLPVINPIILVSKWTAAFLYASLFTFSLETVYGIIAWQQELPASMIAGSIIYYSTFYEMSFVASAALGIVTGAMMPLRFSLPIGFCGWVFGTLFLPGVLVRSYGLYPLKAFSLNHLLDDANYLSWSVSLLHREYLLTQLFVAAFSLFMLAASNAMLARFKPVIRPKLPLVIMFISLCLSAAVYMPYGKLWLNRYDSLDRIEAAAPKPNTAHPHEPYSFKIKSMKLDMTRLLNDDLLAKVVLVLPTEDKRLIPAAPAVHQVKEHFSGQISFLLDPELVVTSLSVDGKSVPWQRSGDFVSFSKNSLAGTSNTHRIELAYGGKINVWNPHSYSQIYAPFVDDNSVLLPGYTGWFPLPGGYSLLMDKETLIPRTDLVSGWLADFDLTLRGFTGPLYSSIDTAMDDKPETRHFTGHSAAAPTLFGGPFSSITLPDEPITIITTPGNVKESKLFLKNLHDKRLYYESWSNHPLQEIKQIAYLSMIQQMFDMTGRNLYATGHTLFVNSSRYQSITDRFQLIIGKLLFGDIINTYEHVNEWNDYTNPYENYSMVQEIRMAILNLPQMEQWVAIDPAFMISPDSDAAPVAVSMQKMINDAFNSGQGDVVKRVLLHFLNQGLLIKDRYSNRNYSNQDIAQQARFIYPTITWKDWLDVWNEEKAGGAK